MLENATKEKKRCPTCSPTVRQTFILHLTMKCITEDDNHLRLHQLTAVMISTHSSRVEFHRAQVQTLLSSLQSVSSSKHHISFYCYSRWWLDLCDLCGQSVPQWGRNGSKRFEFEWENNNNNCGSPPLDLSHLAQCVTSTTNLGFEVNSHLSLTVRLGQLRSQASSSPGSWPN